MTLTDAIKRARSWVKIVGYANGQYVVQRWSPKHNATWQNHPTDYYGAISQAKEAKIRVALEALEVEEAGAEANALCEHEGRWDRIVTNYWHSYTQ